MYIDAETKTIFDGHSSIRSFFKNTSFPSVITELILSDFGVYPLTEIKPDNADYYDLTANEPTEDNGAWTLDYVATLKPAAELKQLVADKRYEHEIAGITLGENLVATDRESQALITGAALASVIDPTYVCQWKKNDGFVTLDATALQYLATQVRTHVQACFNREAELCAEIDSGTFTPSMLWKAGYEKLYSTIFSW